MSALAGRGVALLRPASGDDPLARALAARGARLVCWPALEIAPPADPAPLARARAALESYDWLVATSAHGAAAAVRGGARPATLRVAAVGPATAAAFEAEGFGVDLVGPGPGAEALVERFRALTGVAGTRVLFVAGDRAREVLERGLEALGARVERVEGYRTLLRPLQREAILADVAEGRVEALAVASPSSLEPLAAALGADDLRALLARLAVASIGPATSAALAALGRPPDAEAPATTFEGLAAALERALEARAARATVALGAVSGEPNR